MKGMLHREAWYREVLAAPPRDPYAEDGYAEDPTDPSEGGEEPQVYHDWGRPEPRAPFVPEVPQRGQTFKQWFPEQLQGYFDWAGLHELPDPQLQRVKDQFQKFWNTHKVRQDRERALRNTQKREQLRREKGEARPRGPEDPRRQLLHELTRKLKLLEDPEKYQAYYDKRRQKNIEKGISPRDVDPTEEHYRRVELLRSVEQRIKELKKELGEDPDEVKSERQRVQDMLEDPDYETYVELTKKERLEKILAKSDPSYLKELYDARHNVYGLLRKRYDVTPPTPPNYTKEFSKEFLSIPGITEDENFELWARLNYALREEKDRPLPDEEKMALMREEIKSLHNKLYRKHARNRPKQRLPWKVLSPEIPADFLALPEVNQHPQFEEYKALREKIVQGESEIQPDVPQLREWRDQLRDLSRTFRSLVDNVKSRGRYVPTGGPPDPFLRPIDPNPPESMSSNPKVTGNPRYPLYVDLRRQINEAVKESPPDREKIRALRENLKKLHDYLRKL